MERGWKKIMGDKIVVAHIAGGLTTGGVEQIVYDYAAHMDPGRYRWLYISYNPPDPLVQKRFEKQGFQVYTVPRKKEHFFRSCRAVYRILSEEKVQIVHSHMTVMSFITNVLGRMAGAGMLISHSHLVMYPRGIKIPVYAVFKWLDKVTATHWAACSKAAGAYLFGKRAVEQGKVWIMNNALDYGRWRYSPELRTQTRRAWNLENTVVLGHVGRFTEQKNHRFLLEVFREYQRLVPQSRLVLVGSGPLMQEIQEQAARMKLDKKIIFAGSVQDTAPWYMAMDLFVFPSVYEGLGIAALEAQACGLPVLASREVPGEAAFTECMEFLPLEQGAAQWARRLAEMRTDARDADLGEILRERGLDIAAQAKKLDAFYQKGLESGRK